MPLYEMKYINYLGIGHEKRRHMGKERGESDGQGAEFKYHNHKNVEPVVQQYICGGWRRHHVDPQRQSGRLQRFHQFNIHNWHEDREGMCIVYT